MVLGKITEEGIAELRSRIGSYYRVDRPIEVATKDAIYHFVNSLGDRNPLFVDEVYAKTTCYGCIIAPPCFLTMVQHVSGLKVGGLPGVHTFHSGSDWTWYRATRVNDVISCTFRPVEVVDKPSQFANRLVISYAESIYRNQKGEKLGRNRGWSIRTERQTAREKGKYKDVVKPKYTPEQLQAIWDAYDKEEIRGAIPRYWEDVKEGDEIPAVVKGPWRMIDIALGSISQTGVEGSHIYPLIQRRHHPADAYVDPTTGMDDHPHRGHWEDYMAHQIGVPGAYDLGYHRIACLSTPMMNWVGDDGFLKGLYGEIRRFNVEGDTQWFKAKVVKRYVEGNQHLVDCEVWAVNQHDIITTPGRATAVLPSRSANSYVPM